MAFALISGLLAGKFLAQNIKISDLDKALLKQRKAEFQILYNQGISRESEIIDLGVTHGFVEKAGAWYSVGSERTVHGALLDAKILSQVYLAMTGGQFNLFGEKGSSQNDNIASAKIDSNRGAIKVIAATPAELKAHEAYFEYS